MKILDYVFYGVVVFRLRRENCEFQVIQLKYYSDKSDYVHLKKYTVNMAKEPSIVKCCYKNYTIIPKSDGQQDRSKCTAVCRTCQKVITETRGTTSGFVRYDFFVKRACFSFSH